MIPPPLSIFTCPLRIAACDNNSVSAKFEYVKETFYIPQLLYIIGALDQNLDVEPNVADQNRTRTQNRTSNN